MNQQQSQNFDLSSNDYQLIQSFLSQSCGIILGENKEYLVKNRLSSLLTSMEFNCFSELVSALNQHHLKHAKVKSAVIDAMTTNETFWFRDDSQFVELKQTLLPELFQNKAGTIKIWSAACSSGQEPYTISICVEDVCQQSKKQKNVEIIGTDISETILNHAKTAVYNDMSLSRGLDDKSRKNYFRKVHGGYQLNTEITHRVRFQQFNLLKPYSVLGKFNIIFCRNVLIYFSEQVKKDIINRMADALEPGGCLFLSSTESMPMDIDRFEKVRAGRVQYFKMKS